MQGTSSSVSRMLNRLLGVHVELQSKVFQFFSALLVSCRGLGAPGSIRRHLMLLVLHHDSWQFCKRCSCTALHVIDRDC